LKLFQIVRPHFAFFGEKEYQQLAIVRRVVRDLNIHLQVVGVATVREGDGLRMSSRNRRLTLRERAIAPRLYKALLVAHQAIGRGERDAVVIKELAGEVVRTTPEIKIDYFDRVNPGTIRPVAIVDGPVRAVVAAWIGNTRLIDNVLCEPQLCP